MSGTTSQPATPVDEPHLGRPVGIATRAWVGRVALAVCAGAALTLLVPPYGLHGLHWVVYLPMFAALRPETPRANRWLGWLYGAVSVGLLFRWIADTIALFSNLPWIAAVGVLVLFAAVFGAPNAVVWALVHPLRQRLGIGWVATLPAVAVVVEWMSTFLVLFPYNHGVSQYRAPYTWQLVSVTGIAGLTWLLYFVNACLAEAIYRRREGRPPPLGALAAAVTVTSLVIVFGAWRFERVERTLRDAPVLTFGQLQSSRDMVYRMAHGSRSAFQEWIDLTRRLPPGSADVVVWPEGACPYDLNTGSAAAVLSDLAKEGTFELVVGGGTRERAADAELGEAQVRIFNSVYFFDDQGRVAGRYDKMVPLPFGEYLPLAEQFPWLADLIEGPGNFRAGETAVVVEGARARIAAPICYEAILGRVCRLFEDPDLLVNVTNDAWFGDTAAPHQHAMLAAVRATELGVPVFRSAYTGVSMVVEPHGHIHAETDPFVDVARVVPIRAATVPTLYAQFGDWFVALCAACLTTAWWITRPRS